MRLEVLANLLADRTLMIRIATALTLLAYAGSTAAQFLARRPAWDGLGQDPNFIVQPSKHRARPKAVQPTTTGSIPSTASAADSSSPSWTLENSAARDEENQQIKRKTQICRGC
jgi:hypothetical protein